MAAKPTTPPNEKCISVVVSMRPSQKERLITEARRRRDTYGQVSKLLNLMIDEYFEAEGSKKKR